MEWIDFGRVSCVRTHFTHPHLFRAQICATGEHTHIRDRMTRIQGTFNRFDGSLDYAWCIIGRGRDTRTRSTQIKNLFIISKRLC